MAIPLETFTRQTYTTSTEILTEVVKLFNDASNGCIVLTAGGMMRGGYDETAFYATIAGLVQRRLATDHTTSINQVTMQHAKTNSIRLTFRTPELVLPNDWYAWIDRSPNEAAVVFGRQLAVQEFEGYLRRSFVALGAAMRSGSAPQIAQVTLDVSAATDDVVSYPNLVRGAGLFGDRANLIRAWFMPTTSARNLLLQNLANNNTLFTFGTVNVQIDAERRPIIYTDASGLTEGTSPNIKSLSFGLQAGAISIEVLDDYDSNIEVKNGKENILRTFQAQWSARMSILGYKFNTALLAAGDIAATDAMIASSANWSRSVTNHRDTAGVLLISNLS